MDCRSVMTQHPTCALPTDSAAEAARLMKAGDVGILPVVQDRDSNRLVGVVTDRDLVLHVLADGQSGEMQRVSSFMSQKLVTVRPDEDFERAKQLMISRQVRRLPVVDEQQRVVGVIALADLARVDQPEEVGEVVEGVSMPGGAMGYTMRAKQSLGQSGTMGAPLLLAGGLGLGIGAAYLLRRNRGSVGRQVRDVTDSVKDRVRRVYDAGEDHVDDAQRRHSDQATAARAHVTRAAAEARLQTGATTPGDHPLLSKAKDFLSARMGLECGDRSTVTDRTRLIAGAIGAGLAYYGLNHKKASGAQIATATGIGLLAQAATGCTSSTGFLNLNKIAKFVG